LDIGHYERFIDENLNKYSNVTTGKIYQHVINMERAGKYLGETVQIIPHITNEIKNRIYRENDPKKTDIVITEIGGTIGDIESLPYIEAIRQIKSELGQENVLYIHVTLIPFISSSEEIKTKPTQHSVKQLMQSGIIPDIIVCRTNKHLEDSHKAKIALFCNLPKQNVFENFDEPNIYNVPLMLESQGLSNVICKHFKLETEKIDLSNWNDLIIKQKNISIKNAEIIDDSKVSSTCEMITSLIEFYDVELDSYYATILLSGIVLDTNNYTLNTSAETYYSSYYLASLGASAKKVQYLLKQDINEYTERQKLMADIETIDDKIAFTRASANTIYRREDLAKVADTLLFFNNIEASFVIGKIGKDTIGISARSLGNYDIG